MPGRSVYSITAWCFSIGSSIACSLIDTSFSICFGPVSVPDTATPINLGPTLVEWHGALRWLRLPPQAAPQVRAAAARAGGHATLFRGGDERALVFTPLPPALARIHAQLKQAFDPAGILNLGRLSPDF